MSAYTEARLMLDREMSAVNWHEFSDQEVRDFVDAMWTGGWDAWVEFSTGRKPKDPQMTALQALAHVQDTLGRRINIGLLDVIEDYLITDKEMVLVIDYYETSESKNRLRATAHATKMLGWKLKDGVWHQKKTVMAWDEDFESFQVVGQYGRVTTTDVYNDRVWQEQTCYRPGTSRTPMDGPYAETPSIPYREEV